MNLKQQTTISLIWNGLDKVGFQVIALVVGIITTRILTPTDFGYIAALAVFTTLSNILVESGFTTALVRRTNNSTAEYSAAFIFNILISAVFYAILFISAPWIADYFNIPELQTLSRVIFITIILNAFGIIPNIILTKALKFREIAIADLIGMLVSGVITIYMAISGYGYWAIAAQQITIAAIKTLLLYILSKWTPSRKMDFTVIKEIFTFSSVLIISSVISNGVKYLYNFYIGPRYSTRQLGYYGQAYKFHQIPPTVISTTLSGVSYPVYSQLNDQPDRQKLYIQKMLKLTAFITFPVMLGLYAIAPNFITVVITDKWMPMLPYFKILILTGITYPFYSQMQNIINTIGYPKTNFILDMIRNILIVALLFTLNDTIQQMLIGYVIAHYTATILSCIIVSRYIDYSLAKQLIHVLPSLTISVIMGFFIYAFGEYCQLTPLITLLLQLVLGGIIYLTLAWLMKFDIINDIASMIKNKQIK